MRPARRNASADAAVDPGSDGIGSRPARRARDPRRSIVPGELGRWNRGCARRPQILDEQVPRSASELAEALPHSGQGLSEAGEIGNAADAAEPMPPGIERPESCRARAADQAPSHSRRRRRRDVSHSGDPQSHPVAGPRTPVAALGKAAETAEAVRDPHARTSRRGAAPAGRLPACGDVAQW